MRHSDLDINQHANNVKFVEWVVESAPAKILNSGAISELEINFIAEAHYEDQILAFCSSKDSDHFQYHHSLVREQDGRELARARTRWRKTD